MKIDFSWVNLKDDFEKNELFKYCDSEKAVELCWWMSIDLVNDDKSYLNIIDMIDNLKFGKTDQWRGNSHWLTISSSTIELARPRSDVKYDYPVDDFESALREWKQAQISG